MLSPFVLLQFAALLHLSAAVWPPPQSIALRGDSTPLGAAFQATASYLKHGDSSSRLERAIGRFNALVAPPAAVRAEAEAPHGVLQRLDINVANLDDAPPSISTDYSYALRVASGETNATISAPSIYGAMYALETFAQLCDVELGMLMASSIEVTDAPEFAWRGLMVDAGRRFAPVPLLQNIITTMAAVKLNVLHLHVSDFCRFGVESLLFPNLTAGLVAPSPNAGFYTQDDIKALIAYAADRGVRVVPEFEMPGHALGYLPIAKSGGLEFCTTCAYGKTGDGSHNTCKPSQLWGTNSTARVLKSILGEMAALFSDEVFHIGADETFVKPGGGERCTAEGTAFLEKEIINAVAHDFKKTPAGWEQVLFKTHAATNGTIVYAYTKDTPPSKITAAGYKAVVANGSSLYFTAAAPGGPKGWSKLWYDIGFDVPVEERGLLLGGEMSMWTDTYCNPRECGAMPVYGKIENGSALYNRSRDAAYGRSLGGMIWPRGYVGAAAFWNWNGSADASSTAFANKIWALNDDLAARGSLVCPSNCSCDQKTACGKPF